MKNENLENKFKLGQFFTKEMIVKKLLKIILEYKKYDKNIRILEPSFGTGNFIKVLKKMKFKNIESCEIDPKLTKTPRDFFNYSLSEKFDLIIGNPPFTKYNLKESYYYKKKYIDNITTHPQSYLTSHLLKKTKEKIENVFIMKSLKHLKDKDPSIGFILPISFFIKNRNKEVKKEISKHFSTIVVYQDRKTWFNYNIPCCFAFFTNTKKFRGKIILKFENETDIINKGKLYEEIIPQVHFNKKNGIVENHNGTPLSNLITGESVRYSMSYTKNNVSAKNILEMTKIPEGENIEDYRLSITRVGNASIGKCGLINVKKDTLNAMFFVFDFKEDYKNNKEIKERICKLINENQEYFKNITCRVGSKSIKKSDVFDFKVEI